MAMHVPLPPGIMSMMKSGSRYFSGVEESVVRNIDACKEFTNTIASAYGPNGMNKMVVNHLNKLFVTNDAATIIRELEVEHPAVKLMILGSEMMEQEVGDGTNFVIMFAGALLKEAESLIRMGVKPTDVAEGYELALEKALQVLETLACDEVKDVHDAKEVNKVIRTAVMSKQYGHEDFLADLITKACTSILKDKSMAFNVDNVRVTKILGSSLLRSEVVPGMVFKRDVESNVTKVDNAKVAIYTCPVDSSSTETKGTVLIKTAAELQDFSRGEEQMLEAQIKAIADSGARVLVSGGKIGDMALHYLNKYGLMAVRLTSKWDIRRLCKAVGATPLAKLVAPTTEDLGYADRVFIDEMGDTSIVVFRMQGSTTSAISTIVLRAATPNYLDDIERAINDGVNTFKCLTKDSRLVAGAGAVEMEIAKHVASYGSTCQGLEQYAVQRFADALHVVPRMLAENSGVKSSSEVIAQLMAAHELESGKNMGYNIDAGLASDIVPSEIEALGDSDTPQDNKYIVDALEKQVLEPLMLKHWALRYATNAACTIIKVDKIIMAKRAGGPAARKNGPMDAADDD